MKTVEEILNLYKQRLNYYGPLHSKMKTIQQIYNGTFEIPLPDLEQNSMPHTPNLLAAAPLKVSPPAVSRILWPISSMGSVARNGASVLDIRFLLHYGVSVSIER